MVSDTDGSLTALAIQVGLSPQELDELALWSSFSEREIRELLTLLRSRLNALVGNDPENFAHWMRTHNLHLGGMPLELIQTNEGFQKVMAYLDSFIAR